VVPNIFRAMDAWIDSTKKIRRKTAGGNGRFAIFSTKSHIRLFLCHVSFGLGGIFVYPFVKCSNHGVIQTLKKVANSNIRKGGKGKEAIGRMISAMTESKSFSGRFFGRLKMMKVY
jgi:hypothetical protein